MQIQHLAYPLLDLSNIYIFAGLSFVYIFLSFASKRNDMDHRMASVDPQQHGIEKKFTIWITSFIKNYENGEKGEIH